MFDKLISLLAQFWDYIKCCEIIFSYEEGVLYRFGKDIKILKPGLRWKIPFVDYIITDISVTQTLTIPCQTVISKDLKEITVKSVVKYSISDMRAFQTKVYDRVDALSDTTMVIIKKMITQTDSSLIHLIDEELAKKLRVIARRWGIDIETVSLTDTAKTMSIRQFNENNPNT